MNAARGVQTTKSRAAGGPSGTVQLFVALKPTEFSSAIFSKSKLRLAASLSDQRGARLPRSRRKANGERSNRRALSWTTLCSTGSDKLKLIFPK